MDDNLSESFEKDFNRIVSLIQTARNKAMQKVNEELINLHFSVGKIVSNSECCNLWYASAHKIADKPKRPPPEARLQYPENRENIFVSAVLAQIPWSNHLEILTKPEGIDRMMKKRQGKAITNFERTLPIESCIGQHITDQGEVSV